MSSVKIDEGQKKSSAQSNLCGSCQSIFSLSRHHPTVEEKVRFFSSSCPAASMSSLEAFKDFLGQAVTGAFVAYYCVTGQLSPPPFILANYLNECVGLPLG